MPSPHDDEFRSLIEASGMPWETTARDWQVDWPWNAMAAGAAAVLARHVPVVSETARGGAQCRCSCGTSGLDVDTPQAWALHVAYQVFPTPGS